MQVKDLHRCVSSIRAVKAVLSATEMCESCDYS